MLDEFKLFSFVLESLNLNAARRSSCDLGFLALKYVFLKIYITIPLFFAIDKAERGWELVQRLTSVHTLYFLLFFFAFLMMGHKIYTPLFFMFIFF